MPYIPPIQTWDLLERNRSKNTNYTFEKEIKTEEMDKKTTIRGKRSEILLVPDSKEYYRGINLIQWYWYRLVYKMKKLLHKGD